MKTKHPSAFLPLNRVAVTPTFQSARFAGRKTGATGPHLLMAPMRVHCARLFIVLALAVAVESARAQVTAFTYQGELTYSGALANGVFDLQFTIYAAGSGGSALAGPATRNAVGISNGVFTVLLDFGAGVFTGADRWVEIGARTNGGTFSTLAPRQPLTPAPYAITAANVASGGIPAGTYASPVTFNNTSNSFSGSFTGSGAALTGLNGGGLAAGSVSDSALANGAVTAGKIAGGQVVKSLNGLNDAVTLSAGANITLTPSGNNIQIAASGGPGGGWSLAGNAGTVAGANFIGTTDGQALELKVNGTRALRLEPNLNGAANLIGGSPSNFVASSAFAAVIAGGGTTNFPNSVAAVFGAIGGGIGNTIQTGALDSTIGGGAGNTIQTNASYSTIGGGRLNTVFTFLSDSTIGGGLFNTIQSDASGSTISGGDNNTIGTNSPFATIAGGAVNGIGTNSSSSAIGGGTNNNIAANSATIAGGDHNTIQTAASHSTIGGGLRNTIQTNAYRSTIGGGADNAIQTAGGTYSTIGGGQENTIQSTFSTIGGGLRNTIKTGLSTIGGGLDNTIQTNAFDSTISGGNDNRIETGATFSTIGGGQQNTTSVSGTTIGGGQGNTIQTNAFSSTISGGSDNTIQTGGIYSTIGGGLFNTIQTNANHSTIGGGNGNKIETGASFSTIGGGLANKVSGDQGTIPGGDDNVAGTNSFAAGHRAKATHTGSFVWADSTQADFATTGTNQFLIRASGGVGIGTTNPASALHVNGTARVEDDATLAANATIGGLFALSRVIVAPTANSTLTPTSSYLLLGPASSVTLNGTTAISNGSRTGTILILEGTSDTQTVTINNGANTSLAAASRTLGNDDTLMLLWNGTQWIEISFSNN